MGFHGVLKTFKGFAGAFQGALENFMGVQEVSGGHRRCAPEEFKGCRGIPWDLLVFPEVSRCIRGFP